MVSALGPYVTPSVELLEERLGLSHEAAELYLTSHVIDLHVESYSFYRALGYDPRKRHSGGIHGALVVGQADLPRLLEAGVNGATWVITANPLRPPEDRARTFRSQVAELSEILTTGGRAAIVRTASEYEDAVGRGLHACFLGVQGANALPPHPEALDEFADVLVRITLLHMTSSPWGVTSTPGLFQGRRALGPLGYEFIERMNALGIGVDLAHIAEPSFWEAARASDRTIPLLVTHTGVRGVHNHWRNLSDAQLRMIAERNGTVGIMYHSAYLGDGLFSGRLSSVVAHIQHALRVIGEDHVSLGSDWDGAICTPRDMPTCSELPLLVDALLNSGVSHQAVRKILGDNFLRVVRELKGS